MIQIKHVICICAVSIALRFNGNHLKSPVWKNELF
nr:MAG TPA: hypothetical protein [Caudoviricetes sp.]DAX26400.1 MAG TPA: hypothetical protein [Caudoviricetes sp.]